MKGKYWNKIFIGLCALAMTGMIGVQNVKAQSCSAEGSVGISVDPPNIDVATPSVEYEIRVSNQSFFTDAGGAKLNIAATVFPGTVTVIPACKLDGSCTSKYGQDVVLDFDELNPANCVGLGEAAGFVSCSQNAAGDVIMTVSTTVNIGAASNVVIGNLYFTPSTPVPPADNADGRFWVRAETGPNDLQVNPPNPAFCPGEETGGAEGSTSALFPAVCGDELIGNTTNPTGDVETCDPPESPGVNGTPPYNECRQAGLDNSCQAEGQCAITGDNCDNVCIAGVCSIDGADCTAVPCTTDNVCGPDNLCTLSGDPCVDACPLFQVGFCPVVEYDYACTYCGDGLLRPDAPVPSGPTPPAPNFTGFEVCDNGASNSDLPGDATTCRTWCAPAICGDGIVDPALGETCDPPEPGSLEPDACRADCTFCGDGVLDNGEECDPNDPTSIPPDANCSDTCELVRICGDSIIGNTTNTNGQVETCDPPGQPGPNPPGGICRSATDPDACTYCGDEIIQTSAGEQCEPALSPPGTCDDACQIVNFCGDEIVGNSTNAFGYDETCDPPGSTPTDPPGNTNTCRGPGDDECTYCGDGVVNEESGEQCDDGNNINTDACDNTCQYTECAVELVKEVSCDGGITWFDAVAPGCSALDGQEIKIRYTATNTGTQDLGICDLSDSNTALFPPALPQFPLPFGGPAVITTSDQNECSATLDDLEIDTATVTCECALDNNGPATVTATDQANFECINCGVDIVKGVGATGGPYGDAYTTVDHQLVGYEITISSTGDNVVGDCFLEDAMLFPAPVPVVPGQPITVPNQQCEDGVVGDNDIEGINTATVTCATCFDAAGNALTPDTPYTATDTADLDCLTPDVSTTKSCDEQPDGGGYTYTFTFDNPGDTEFECAIYDTLTPGACGDPTGSTDPLVTVNVPMNDAGPYVWTFENVPITETSCNNATIACTVINPATGAAEMDECNPATGLCVWSDVQCDPAGPIDQCGPKMIVEDINAPCEVLGGCFTRTPGFWGSKRMITQYVLDQDPAGVESCGLTLDNTEYAIQGSAVEDVCSTGNDKSYVHYEPQQIQLIRQCTAAALNQKASMELGGSCRSLDVPYFANFGEAFDTCCTDACANGEVLDNCIYALDEFNNWEGADELVWDGMCDYQDNAKGGNENCGANNCNKGGDGVSKRARNNGWVNCREGIAPEGPDCPYTPVQ